MDKSAILLGIMLVGLSFAQPAPSGMGWSVYAEACCQYWSVDSLLSYGYSNYALYENECMAGYEGFTSEGNIIRMIMFGGFVPNGLDSYYFDMENACSRGGEGTQECASAKAAFYSRAAFARASFNNAKMYYYAEAAQAVRDNRMYGKDCTTARSATLPALAYARDAYNRCRADPWEACLGAT